MNRRNFLKIVGAAAGSAAVLTVNSSNGGFISRAKAENKEVILRNYFQSISEQASSVAAKLHRGLGFSNFARRTRKLMRSRNV